LKIIAPPTQPMRVDTLARHSRSDPVFLEPLRQLIRGDVPEGDVTVPIARRRVVVPGGLHRDRLSAAVEVRRKPPSSRPPTGSPRKSSTPLLVPLI
jgi:hypothetical protein